MKAKHGPLITAPRAPAHLPKTAQTIWTAICNYLLDRELLHSGDLPTIEAFCWASARLRRIESELEQQPLFTDEGRPHPGISAANGTASAVAKLASALGLAPVSRTRLNAATQRGDKKSAGEDGWLEVLDGGKK
jgi:P27 family predicted phage terminase small subunit